MNADDEVLVGDLCAIEDGLTGWELDFCESVAKQVTAGRTLTDKQRDKINSILERLGK